MGDAAEGFAKSWKVIEGFQALQKRLASTTLRSRDPGVDGAMRGGARPRRAQPAQSAQRRPPAAARCRAARAREVARL